MTKKHLSIFTASIILTALTTADGLSSANISFDIFSSIPGTSLLRQEVSDDKLDLKSAAPQEDPKKTFKKNTNDNFIIRYPNIDEEDFKIAQENNLKLNLEYDPKVYEYIYPDPLSRTDLSYSGAVLENQSLRLTENSSFDGPILSSGSLYWEWTPDLTAASFTILSTRNQNKPKEDFFSISYSRGKYYFVVQSRNGSRKIRSFKLNSEELNTFKLVVSDVEMTLFVNSVSTKAIPLRSWKIPDAQVFWTGRGVLDNINIDMTDLKEVFDFTVQTSEIRKIEDNPEEYNEQKVNFQKWLKDTDYQKLIKK